MTILSAMQSASLRLMGRKPTTFFGAPGQFEREITDYVNEVAIDVCQYRDWQALVRLNQISGDGVTSEFDLPDDYDRMMVDSQMDASGSWLWGFHRLRNISELDNTLSPGGWIIYNNKLRFAPAPSGNATFPYITKNYAIGESTAPKAEFDADSDIFLLPERLLTLGLVWRWRENKKLDGAGDQEAFIKALDEYAAKDGGSNVTRFNSRINFPGTFPAWPGLLG